MPPARDKRVRRLTGASGVASAGGASLGVGSLGALIVARSVAVVVPSRKQDPKLLPSGVRLAREQPQQVLTEGCHLPRVQVLREVAKICGRIGGQRNHDGLTEDQAAVEPMLRSIARA